MWFVKRQLPQCLCSVVLTACLFAFYAVGLSSMQAPDSGHAELRVLEWDTRAYAPHDVISINGDVDFASQAAAEAWLGDGTEGSPYVIADYSVDAGGGKQAIFVGNTSVHFAVSGCYVTGASESGILLLNVTNSTIGGNTCVSNAWYGIALVNSDANNLSRNDCEGSPCGILLISSHSNLMANNSCAQNGDGIVLRTSNNNVLWWNVCDLSDGDGASSFGDGVRLVESDWNEIRGGSCYMNERYQIRLEYCQNCAICDGYLTGDYYLVRRGISLFNSGANTVSDMTLVSSGILLEHSDGNDILGCEALVSLTSSSSNVVTGCSGQVNLVSSNWNSITWNDCSNSLRGVLLDNSHNNTVSNNTCTDGVEGIHVFESNDNLVADNDARYNEGIYISMSSRPRGYGIIMEESRDNQILRNDCSYAMIGSSWWACGICLFACEMNTLSENIVTYSEGTGIYINGLSNVARCNTVEHNGLSSISAVDRSGIVLSSSTTCLIESNTVRYNFAYGIKVEGNQNSIVGNLVESNLAFGIFSNALTSGNTYQDNIMVDDGISPDSEYETVDTSNTVNGKPVRHLKSQIGGSVPSGAGQAILYMCTGVTVSDQNLSMADVGVSLVGCTGCVVLSNTCNYGMVGMILSSSSSNTIMANNLSANSAQGLLVSGDNNDVRDNGVFDNTGYGIEVGGNGNIIWNNTLARNNGASSVYDSLHRQAYSTGSNLWNKSSYGNYWGDWTTPDLDFDGIVDQPYVLGGSGMDYYPRTSPTVNVPPAIPEFGPPALALLVLVCIAMISAAVRVKRR